MTRDCPRFKELNEILGDRCKSAARPHNTGQSSQEPIEPRRAEVTSDHSSGESVAGPSTLVHRVVAGGSNDPSSVKGRGKQKLASDVVLGDTPIKSPVAVITEEYLGKSLFSIQKKEAKARLMIEFIQQQAQGTAEDPAETEKKVKKAIGDIFK
ncbi:hypothetical protein MAM1_0248c08688 [Mucor ambiguus]|uniref:Uncharacterized protein n=1 Tax=Mucor ambiguus TaxID=91626 RepID=A0A0C9MER4_9FUNG|nr:hypothetical protein MAM1_0248c08688 [Mucor ambiguus]